MAAVSPSSQVQSQVQSQVRAQLEERLLSVFARGVDVPLPEPEFTRLALAVFAYQFERNPPYQSFCRTRRRTPAEVTHWRDVPAVPTAAFKAADLTTIPPEQAGVVYLTSGTTAGTRPGRHLLPDTRLYDASLLPNFRAHVLPDMDGVRILVLGPTEQHFPNSSLGHMYTRVLDRWGSAGSGIFWRDDGALFGCLASALAKAEREGAPVCLLGTAFGFVRFLDWLAERSMAFRLPPGSRLMDTGGYKGRSREVPKEELYALYGKHLGIPATRVVNEYGMTELGSQFYDRTLRELAGGGAVSGAGSGRRRKTPPPWVRIQVVDPELLAPVPHGEVGLLRFYDLANLHSVAAIQTDDLGRRIGDGFEILGRAPGAEPRGCSLAAEEFRAARS